VVVAQKEVLLATFSKFYKLNGKITKIVNF